MSPSRTLSLSAAKLTAGRGRAEVDFRTLHRSGAAGAG